MADLNYIESGYFTPEKGYYVYTADADAALSSQSSVVATVGVIKSAASALVVQVSMTASIVNLEGTDMFAFTEATIAIQVDRIRDNNTAVSGNFTVAADVARIRSTTADEQAMFEAVINGLRVRINAAQFEAAFSLSATAEKRTQDFYYLDAFSNIAVDFTRVRFVSASVNAESTLSAVISHIEGADLSAFTNASLTASVDRKSVV